jgi:sn-glycerol 3-phosphate transport system substrate-binding protein
MFSIDAYDLIEQDLIVPFDEIVEGEEGMAWLNSFYPALMANGKIEGQTWGIPFQRSTIVAYYNKDMFREAGPRPRDAAHDLGRTGRDGQALTTDDRWA